MPELTKRQLGDLLDQNGGEALVTQLKQELEDRRKAAEKSELPQVRLSAQEWATVKSVLAARQGKTGDFMDSYRAAIAAMEADDKDEFMAQALVTLARMRGQA